MKSPAAAVVLASSVLVIPVLMIACSGSSPQDLFAPQPSDVATEPSASGSSGSSGSSGTSGSSGSSGTSGSSGSSGASGSSGSSGSSGTSGGGKDAGPDASSWKSPGIFCGTDPGGAGLYCAPTSTFCCSRQQNDPAFECLPGGTLGQCATGVTIKCDDRTDCPASQVCCGTFEQATGYRNVQCQAECTGSPIPSQTTVRFCDASAPTDECLAIGKACSPSGSLDGFHICK